LAKPIAKGRIMARTSRQRNSGFTAKKPLGMKYGKRVQLGHGGPTVVQPKVIPRGWQDVKLKVPTKIVTCEEYECTVYINDRVDPTTGALIRAGTLPCGAIHRMWDGREPMYEIHYGGEPIPRLVNENQFIDELCAGVDFALNFIKAGSYESSRKS
jgi:hypothetical protein